MIRITYILLAALLITHLSWPYISVYGLFSDLKSQDVHGVEGRVDWPTLRTGLAADIQRFAQRKADEALASEVNLSTRTKISLNWSSLPIVEEIADVFATPQGLIALYENPGAIACAVTAAKTGDGTRVSECLDRQREKAAPQKQPLAFEGPNVSRIFDKLGFAFFTGVFSFRLSLLHEGFPLPSNSTARPRGGF